jgi:hypothetical protein
MRERRERSEREREKELFLASWCLKRRGMGTKVPNASRYIRRDGRVKR